MRMIGLVSVVRPLLGFKLVLEADAVAKRGRISVSNADVHSRHSSISLCSLHAQFLSFSSSFALVLGGDAPVQRSTFCHASSSWRIVDILRFAFASGVVVLV